MRYLLILAIAFVSMCAGLPEIPFFNTGDGTVQKAGFVIMDAESPDLFISAEAIPTEVRAGRNVNVYFELRNKNNYDLKNVKLTEWARYSASDCPAGMVSYYNFDGGSGTTVEDNFGNNID
jgi:cold shock CspA family protein